MMKAMRDGNWHFKSDKVPPVIDSTIAGSSLLIIDDQEPNIRLLEMILESAGYSDIRGISDPRIALAVCRERRPDLILLDLQMPHITGLPLMKLLLEEFSDETYFPILVLTADLTPEAKRKALACGAKDFVPKPFDSAELLLRIANLLKTRGLYRQIQVHNGTLEQTVEERTRALAEAEIEMLKCLALAAEYRDDETGQHTQRVGTLAAMIAEVAGQSPEEIGLLAAAAPLHDIGKIGIPDRILLKPGRLTAEEFALMKSHTLIGEQILGRSQFPVMQVARQIALSHHERWDGAGYPQALAGESIPLVARITAIADVFDAVTHARPYKEAWPVEKALDAIDKESGRHFDPKLASAFLSILSGNALERLAERLNSGDQSSRMSHTTLPEAVNSY
jgi:putative two-component system response regulator